MWTAKMKISPNVTTSKKIWYIGCAVQLMKRQPENLLSWTLKHLIRFMPVRLIWYRSHPEISREILLPVRNTKPLLVSKYPVTLSKTSMASSATDACSNATTASAEEHARHVGDRKHNWQAMFGNAVTPTEAPVLRTKYNFFSIRQLSRTARDSDRMKPRWIKLQSPGPCSGCGLGGPGPPFCWRVCLDFLGWMSEQKAWLTRRKIMDEFTNNISLTHSRTGIASIPGSSPHARNLLWHLHRCKWERHDAASTIMLRSRHPLEVFILLTCSRCRASVCGTRIMSNTYLVSELSRLFFKLEISKARVISFQFLPKDSLWDRIDRNKIIELNGPVEQKYRKLAPGGRLPFYL